MSEDENPLKTMSKAVGGNLTKERRNQLYFGKPPKGSYYGMEGRDLTHIHDLMLSDSAKRRLYGLGGGRQETTGEIVEARLGTDSKADLVRELADNTSLTRKQAEDIVERWMLRNDLVERVDETLGRIIVPRDAGGK